MIDIRHSASNDLSKPSAWNSVLISLHHFALVGIDLPCNTWSRARRAPWWSSMPKALRGNSDAELFGKPHLGHKDFQKVQGANNMCFGAARVIRRCLRLGIPGYLENPRASRLWLTPQMRRLPQDPRVQLVHTDLCQFGTQWRKATSLLIWNVKAFTLPKCHGRQGFCSRTHRRHLQLTGVVGGRFLSERAQVYPKLFAQTFVQTLMNPPRPAQGHSVHGDGVVLSSDVWVSSRPEGPGSVQQKDMQARAQKAHGLFFDVCTSDLRKHMSA